MSIRVGVIGCGDGGTCNALSLVRCGAEISALSDMKVERMRTLEEQLEVPFGHTIRKYERYEDLVGDPDIDLVVVTTQDDQHLEPARRALTHGKWVFVEKPLETNLETLREFAEIAKHTDRLLFSEKYSFAHPVARALELRETLGRFFGGSTSYTMFNCDRIMGGGKWRTEIPYNPCAGGLSHNFMTALLFTQAPIVRITAVGQVNTYHENLDREGGYDTMHGVLEFKSGQILSWQVCLSVKGPNSPFGHRTVTHTFQFEHGSLVYGPRPESDMLIADGKPVWFAPEPEADKWKEYNLGLLHLGMHQTDTLGVMSKSAVRRHTIKHGINVAAACILAFESAKNGGVWKEIPSEFQLI